MNRRKRLRAIGFAMLLAAGFFVLCAVSAPTWGEVIDIGGFTFGPEIWRVCYRIYAIAVVALFAASFLIKDQK